MAAIRATSVTEWMAQLREAVGKSRRSRRPDTVQPGEAEAREAVRNANTHGDWSRARRALWRLKRAAARTQRLAKLDLACRGTARAPTRRQPLHVLHFRTSQDEEEPIYDKGALLGLARHHVREQYGSGRCGMWQRTYLLVLGARARASGAEPMRVLQEHVKAAIQRAGPGKAPGRTGIVAEHVQAGGAQTCSTLTQLFQMRVEDHTTTDSVGTWDEIVLCLLPKKTKVILQDMRPIALGEVVRNIFVRTVIEGVISSGRLRMPPWQFGFRKGYQCLDVLHRVEAILLKAAEWGIPVVVARLDVASAFDSIAYDRLARAMERAGMTPKEVFVIMREVSNTKAYVRVAGQTSSEPEVLEKGGRQGGPETPLLWSLYLGAALEEVVQGWSSQRARAGVDLEAWLAARGRGIAIRADEKPDTAAILAWADDIFLVAHDEASMQGMVRDTLGGLRTHDLRVKPSKVQLLHSKWASVCSIVVDDQVVVSTGELECLGCTLQGDGGISGQLDRAIQKGCATFQKHRAMLTNRITPVRVRFRAWLRTVAATMRWGLAAYPRSAEQLRALDKAQSRQLLQIAAKRPKPDEGMSAWQRRRYMWLKNRMCSWGIPKLSALVQGDLHSWAGHVARQGGSLNLTLQWRDTTWWQQQLGDRTRPGPGVDRRPAAGRPLRWEDPMVAAIGPAWREIAQDRVQWRSKRTSMNGTD